MKFYEELKEDLTGLLRLLIVLSIGIIFCTVGICLFVVFLVIMLNISEMFIHGINVAFAYVDPIS